MGTVIGMKIPVRWKPWLAFAGLLGAFPSCMGSLMFAMDDPHTWRDAVPVVVWLAMIAAWPFSLGYLLCDLGRERDARRAARARRKAERARREAERGRPEVEGEPVPAARVVHEGRHLR